MSNLLFLDPETFSTITSLLVLLLAGTAFILLGTKYILKPIMQWLDSGKAPVMRAVYTSAMVQAADNADQAKLNLATFMAQAEASGGFHHRTLQGLLLADHLFNRLDSKIIGDYLVEKEVTFCDIKKINCSVSAKLTGPLGNVIYMSYETALTRLVDTQDRNVFVVNDQSANPRDYIVDKNNNVHTVRSVKFIFTNTIDDSHPDVAGLTKLLENSKMEAVRYEIDRKASGISYTYKLADIQGEIGLIQSSFQMRYLDNDEINRTYADIPIVYNDLKKEILPSDALDIMILTLLNKGNVQITGPMGTGKSTMSLVLQQRLAEMGARIVTIPASQITELGTSKFSTGLTKLFSRRSSLIAEELLGDGLSIEDEKPENQLVFVIDQAENPLRKHTGGHTVDNTILLEMLDGRISKETGCSVLMIVDTSVDEINEFAERANRQHFVATLRPLPEAKALQAVEVMKKTMPNHVFNESEFYAKLKSTTWNSENTRTRKEVSKSGFLTLAEVAACFRPKEVTDVITNAIRRASGEPLLSTDPAKSLPGKVAPKQPAEVRIKEIGNRPPGRLTITPAKAQTQA